MALSQKKKDALWKRIRSKMFWIALIAASKVALAPLGITFIKDEDIDAASNGIATFITLIGIFWGYDDGKAIDEITEEV